MGSADQLVRSFRRREPAHRRNEQALVPPRFAWPILVVSTICRSALCTALALLLWAILPNFVGFHTTVVMSGSMSPHLAVGDAVVVRSVNSSQLSPGQILLFDDPDAAGRLRMHRLMSVEDDGLVTKGDANASADSDRVGFDAVHGAAFLRIPYAGLPEYWLRTGDVVPIIGGGLIAALLLAGIRLERLLEEPEERRRRRHRGVRVPGLHRAAAASAAIVVLAGATVVAPPSSAQASYKASTTSVGSWSPCGDRVVDRGISTAPRFAWGYAATSTTSTAVADAPTLSGTALTAGADPGTVSGGFTRQTGCAGTSSPYISLGPAKGVIVESRAASSRPAAVTIATWFRTTTPGAVIADFGDGSGTTGSSSLDRALYIDANGKVAFTNFIVSLGATVSWTCTGTSTVTGSGAGWHLVVATWSASTGCRLWVDSSPVVTNAPALGITLSLTSGYAGRWRVGYDKVANSLLGLIPTGSTDYPFIGDLDETRVWDSVLPDSDVTTLLTRAR